MLLCSALSRRRTLISSSRSHHRRLGARARKHPLKNIQKLLSFVESKCVVTSYSRYMMHMGSLALSFIVEDISPPRFSKAKLQKGGRKTDGKVRWKRVRAPLEKQKVAESFKVIPKVNTKYTVGSAVVIACFISRPSPELSSKRRERERYYVTIISFILDCDILNCEKYSASPPRKMWK